MTTTLDAVLRSGPHGPGPMGHGGGMGGMGPHAGWWGWLVGPWLATLLALLVLAGVALLVWRLAGRERRREAVRTLEEQYARGAIGDEEFERRRARLTGDRSGSDPNSGASAGTGPGSG